MTTILMIDVWKQTYSHELIVDAGDYLATIRLEVVSGHTHLVNEDIVKASAQM